MRFVHSLSVPLLAAAANAAEPSPAPPTAGPIAIDMTIAEAKAAAPNVKWQDEISPYTGKTRSTTGPAACTLEGHAYDVRVRPLSYGAAQLTLSGKHKVEKLEDCRARVLALAEHFDRFFDSLEPRMSASEMLAKQLPPTITAQRSPEGHLYITVQPNSASTSEGETKRAILAAGRSAKLREVVTDDETASWDFMKHASRDYDYSIGADASFSRDFYTDKTICRITADLHSHPKGRPAFETLDAAKIKPIATPSPTMRHHSIDGLELAPDGLTFQFSCNVQRGTGRLVDCIPAAKADERTLEMRAARRRLREYRYEPKQLDPDNDLSLRTDVTIRLSPQDRDPALSAAAPAAPVWTKMATAREQWHYYPAGALNLGQEAYVVATCRIEASRSLNCTSFEIHPPEQTAFEQATRRVLSHYRAAPRLKNDAPAAGAVVKVPVRFRIAD